MQMQQAGTEPGAAAGGMDAAAQFGALAAGDAPAGALDRLLALAGAGGPVVALLVLMSVFALAIVLTKAWHFHRVRLEDAAAARRMLAVAAAGNPGQAAGMAGPGAAPVAAVLAVALDGLARGMPDHVVREEVQRVGAAHLAALRAWFRPLEVIGSLAPLLGLFGTVLGMIEAFRQMEAAGARVDPSVLSGGIWEALLTTAVGLAVAIPAVAALNWLEARVDRAAHRMEDVASRAFTGACAMPRASRAGGGRQWSEDAFADARFVPAGE